MKTSKSYIYIFRLSVAAVIFTVQAAAQDIRIVPQAITVENDSLRLNMLFDLRGVEVNSLTALTFTPQLSYRQQTVSLPAVVVTGKRRYRYEQREQGLASGRHTTSPPPFRIIREGEKNNGKQIDYRATLPYAAWMQHASLLLRQEIKDCCDLRLLAVDTLTRRLGVGATPQPPAPPKKVAAAPPPKAVPAKEEPKPQPVVVAQRPQKVESAILYIDYPLNKYEVYPDFRNNRKELDKIDRILAPLLADSRSTIERIRIRGYASPDGPYRHNEILSYNRSNQFMGYLRDTYRLSKSLFEVSSVAEDWEGLVDLLNQEMPPYRWEVIGIIRQYGILDGREKRLMDLRGGSPYKDMLRRLFPRLRRIEVYVEYRTTPKKDEQQ